jgi:hypothetical protein
MTGATHLAFLPSPHATVFFDGGTHAHGPSDALGRATDSGDINAIRSTLDRLVGSSRVRGSFRVRRTGRGLYRAGQS